MCLRIAHLLTLFIFLFQSSCAFLPKQYVFREPAQSRSKPKPKQPTCDPESAFVKNTPLVCGGCAEDEFCITVYYDRDTFASIKSKILPLLRAEVATQRNVTTNACRYEIEKIADEMATFSLSSTAEFKNHPDRIKDKHVAQMVPYAKSSIHTARSIVQSCGDDCEALINTGREWAKTVADGADLLREKDVRTNIAAWKKELKVPVACHGRFEIALREIFKPKLNVVINTAPAGSGTGTAEEEILGSGSGAAGSGSGAAIPGTGTVPGTGAAGSGSGGTGSDEVGLSKTLCQPIPEEVIVGTDGGKCLADEEKLWTHLRSMYLKNLNETLKKSMTTPVVDCTQEDISGGADDTKPTPNGMKNVKVPCDACVTSSEVVTLLSEDIDKNNESWKQKGKDWLDYNYCWRATLGYGTSFSGIDCQTYIKKYQHNLLWSNGARLIGPESLPAIEQALEEFERKGYESDRYRRLINGAIRVPTGVLIPGLNRRICMVGDWITYEKSQAMRAGELRANAESEKYRTWDRNFGQGAASSVANWLSMVGANPYKATEAEIDCVSIPARLVREAMKEKRCGGINEIREMINEGLKAQGQGKALINTGVAIASGILPVGLAGSAAIACGQGIADARFDMNNKESRMDKERLAMVVAQNRKELSKAQALEEYYKKNKASWDEEKTKLYTAGYWSILENCVKGAATVGVYYQITQGLNKAVTITKVRGTPQMFFEKLANSPVLLETVVYSVAKREITWVEVVSALPIELRVEGLTYTQLKEAVEQEMAETGDVSPKTKAAILTRINSVQSASDKTAMKQFVQNLSESVGDSQYYGGKPRAGRTNRTTQKLPGAKVEVEETSRPKPQRATTPVRQKKRRN